MSSNDEKPTGQPHLHKQDLKTLDITKLNPLSPEVISRQATINIGTIGHVAHGKSTVVKAISGVQTVRFKNELERNITIKLEPLTQTKIDELKSPSKLRAFVIELENRYPTTYSFPKSRVTLKRKLSAPHDTKLKQAKIFDFLEFLPRRPIVTASAERELNAQAIEVIENFDTNMIGRDLNYSDSDIASTSSDLKRSNLSIDETKPAAKKRKSEVKRAPPKKNVEYKVEKIVEIDEVGGAVVFKVKWQDYPDADNTWEPLEHVRDVVGFEEFLDTEMEKYKEAVATVVQDVKAEISVDIAGGDLTVPAVPEEEYSDTDPLPDIDIEGFDHLQLKGDLIVLAYMKWAVPKVNLSKMIWKRVKRALPQWKVWQKRSVQLNVIEAWQQNVKELENGSIIRVENNVDFETPPANFTYIVENIPGEGVEIQNDPVIGCNCEGGCSVRTQCCPKMSNANFAYHPNKRLRVIQGVPIYECNKLCKCSADCRNRVVQLDKKPPMRIFKTEDGRGWGVRAENTIYDGQYVCEYLGEIIQFDEAEKRGQQYDAVGRTYLYDLDFNDSDNPYTLDAACFGNIARFINHSCDPNCGIWATWIDCLDPNLPKIAFFAKRRIEAGEELTIDYLNLLGGPKPSQENESTDEAEVWATPKKTVVTETKEPEIVNKVTEGEAKPESSAEKTEDGEAATPEEVQSCPDKTADPEPVLLNEIEKPETSKYTLTPPGSPRRQRLRVTQKDQVSCKCGAPICRKFIF